MDKRYFRFSVTMLAIIFLYRGTCISQAYPTNPWSTLNTAGKKYAIVTATSLNIRSEPSTQGTVVTKAVKGEKLEVIETKGEWIKVKNQAGVTGWSIAKYLSPEGENKAKPAATEETLQQEVKSTPKSTEPDDLNSSSSAVKKYAIVTANSLNIRSEPSPKGAVVASTVKGDKVEVIDTKGEWIQVKTPAGITGWSSKKYLSIEGKPAPQSKPQRKKDTSESRSAGNEASASFGVMGGVALAQLSGKSISNDFSPRLGFTGGALAFFPLSNCLALQPEVLYVMKGAVRKTGDQKKTIQLDYIDLPILFRLTLMPKKSLSPYITVGPVLSYNSQALATGSGTNSSVQEITDVKKLDYGASAGGGIQFSLGYSKIMIDARYYMGLAQIHDTKTDPLDLKNNCLTITLCWLFL